MNILYTSVAISQLKCLDYAFFVAKMSKMTFTRFGGQVLLDGGQVRQFRGRVYGLDMDQGASPEETATVLGMSLYIRTIHWLGDNFSINSQVSL